MFQIFLCQLSVVRLGHQIKNTRKCSHPHGTRKSSGRSGRYGTAAGGGRSLGSEIGSPREPGRVSGTPTTILSARSSVEFCESLDGSAGGSGASGFVSSKPVMLFSSPSAARAAIQTPVRQQSAETGVRDGL